MNFSSHKKRDREVPFLFRSETELLQMLADQASQFKHGDLGFAEH